MAKLGLIWTLSPLSWHSLHLYSGFTHSSWQLLNLAWLTGWTSKLSSILVSLAYSLDLHWPHSKKDYTVSFTFPQIFIFCISSWQESTQYSEWFILFFWINIFPQGVFVFFEFSLNYSQWLTFRTNILLQDCVHQYGIYQKAKEYGIYPCFKRNLTFVRVKRTNLFLRIRLLGLKSPWTISALCSFSTIVKRL